MPIVQNIISRQITGNLRPDHPIAQKDYFKKTIAASHPLETETKICFSSDFSLPVAIEQGAQKKEANFIQFIENLVRPNDKLLDRVYKVFTEIYNDYFEQQPLDSVPLASKLLKILENNPQNFLDLARQAKAFKEKRFLLSSVFSRLSNDESSNLFHKADFSAQLLSAEGYGIPPRTVLAMHELESQEYKQLISFFPISLTQEQFFRQTAEGTNFAPLNPAQTTNADNTINEVCQREPFELSTARQSPSHIPGEPEYPIDTLIQIAFGHDPDYPEPPDDQFIIKVAAPTIALPLDQQSNNITVQYEAILLSHEIHQHTFPEFNRAQI